MKVFIFVRGMFRKFPVLLTITVVLAVSASIIEAVSIFTVGPLIDSLTNSDLQNSKRCLSHPYYRIRPGGVLQNNSRAV